MHCNFPVGLEVALKHIFERRTTFVYGAVRQNYVSAYRINRSVEISIFPLIAIPDNTKLFLKKFYVMIKI